MGKLISLEEVNASVLPAKVLVLLSKYAQAMRKHTGLVIKISSLNVFKHVHNTNKLTDHLQIRKLHRELLIDTDGMLRGKDGEVLSSRNGSSLNSNNLEIESSLSINL